jgi:hypothetical protein
MEILRCTELLLSKNMMRSRIHICPDSRVAIAALSKTATESALVWEGMQALEILSESNKVTVAWIITEKWEMEKLINWPRKGLIKCLQIKSLAFPLLWAKKSSGVT